MPVPQARHQSQFERLEHTSAGTRIHQVWIITGAMGIAEAEAANDLPAYGNGHPARPDLLALQFDIRTADGSAAPKYGTVTGQYVAEITYGAPSSSLMPAPEDRTSIEYNFGSMTQRLYVDLNGCAVETTKQTFANGMWAPIYDLDGQAEPGMDVQVPTLEIQIVPPVADSFSPSGIFACASCVNATPFTVDGFPIPPGYVLFQGAGVIPLWDGYQFRHQRQLRFTVGAQIVPVNANGTPLFPLFWNGESNSSYTGPLPIPLQYGIYPTYYPCDENGAYNPAGKGRRASGLRIGPQHSQVDLSWLLPADPRGRSLADPGQPARMFGVVMRQLQQQGRELGSELKPGGS